MPSRIRTMNLPRRALVASRRLSVARTRVTASAPAPAPAPCCPRRISRSLQLPIQAALRGSSTSSLHLDPHVHALQGQRRTFASASVSSPPITITNEVKPDDPSSSSNSSSNSNLFYAAQEAARLSKIAVKEHKRGTKMTEASVQQALNAASALLIVSTPTNALADAIRHRTRHSANANAPHIASLHRAFLEITSWCVDLVLVQPQATASATATTTATETIHLDNNSVLLDRSLTLARRAYDLSLPFHLPLYQRLMEAVASHKMDSNIASTILDISSWVSATLNAPVDAVWFSHALTTLVRRQRLGEVVDLLKGMQLRHDIPYLDPTTTTDMLSLLRDAVRESLQNQNTTDNNNNNMCNGLNEADATDIVSLLEPSVMHVLEQRESSETLRDRLTNLLSELENDEMAELLERLAQVEDDDIDSDHDDDDDDDDVDSDSDHDVDSDEEAYDDDEDRMARVDPIDLVVDSILTKKVTDVKAKRLLSDLIKNSKSGGDGNNKHHHHPRIQTIEFKKDGNTIRGVKLEIDDTDDSDLSDEESDDVLYSRSKTDLYQFPDVTAQLVQLNAGRSLLFTRRFEDILWARDYHEDDDVLFDSIFQDAHHTKDPDDDDDSGGGGKSF